MKVRYASCSAVSRSLGVDDPGQPVRVAVHVDRRRGDAAGQHLLEVDRRHCLPVSGGSNVRVRGAAIRVFSVQHDRIFGQVPFDRPARALPPRRVGDWVCGEPLAFLIEMGGQRIYLESGGRPGVLPRISGQVDLAILGVALPDARSRFPEIVAALRPRYVLPSHQDDFFRPLDRGFRFGPLTDFSGVLRAFHRLPVPSNLILLDYHRPWTLR